MPSPSDNQTATTALLLRDTIKVRSSAQKSGCPAHPPHGALIALIHTQPCDGIRSAAQAFSMIMSTAFKMAAEEGWNDVPWWIKCILFDPAADLSWWPMLIFRIKKGKLYDYSYQTAQKLWWWWREKENTQNGWWNETKGENDKERKKDLSRQNR